MLLSASKETFRNILVANLFPLLILKHQRKYQLTSHLRDYTFFFFSVETGSCYVVQAVFKLPASSHPPDLASQSAGIIDVSHRAQPGTVHF